MNLHQMQALKRWHVVHRDDHPVEYRVYDAVLTAWVLGWVGVPAALLLAPWHLMPLCLLCSLAPELYVSWRAHMHERHRLRCDWLDALARAGH